MVDEPPLDFPCEIYATQSCSVRTISNNHDKHTLNRLTRVTGPTEPVSESDSITRLKIPG